MATWTLVHTRSPLNTPSDGSLGNGQFGELTKASNRQLSFSTTGDTTLSFSMPGNHAQTAQIVPLISDVLAIRSSTDAVSGTETGSVVQRFRVVGRQLDKADGVLTASFSAVSYKSLLNAWFFHAGDTRSWSAAGDPAHAATDGTEVNQEDIAWRIFNDGQTKAQGSLGVIQGTGSYWPATHVPLVYSDSLAGTVTWHGLVPPQDAGVGSNYFDAGKDRGSAIQELADLINGGPGSNSGFEWDIIPNPLLPYTSMIFCVWALVDGGRNQHAPDISDLVLDDGGNLASWSHTSTPSEYANVIRFTGADPVTDNISGATIEPTLIPGEDPTGIVPEGRWERDINNADIGADKLKAAGLKAYQTAHDYMPELTVTLRRGRWRGPSQLWLGDRARVIITEAVADLGREPVPGNNDDWIVYIGAAGDPFAKVSQIDVSVDEQNAEDVSLTLDRTPNTTRDEMKGVLSRLQRLERR